MAALALAHSACVRGRAWRRATSPRRSRRFCSPRGRGVTGVALVAVFAVMWALSLPVIRRTRRFELFYASHMLYAAWFALAVAHAPTVLAVVGRAPRGFGDRARAPVARRRGVETFAVAAQAVRSGVTRLDVRSAPRASPSRRETTCS